MNIGIYIYDDAEVLDFSGPFEVFSTANRFLPDEDKFNVLLVAEKSGPVAARAGYSVNPHVDFTNHPPLDVLVVVGGIHMAEVKKSAVTQWIAEQDKTTSITASVCTGAFLLAEAGVIKSETVTTHWQDIADLKADYPSLTLVEGKRWVDQGRIITSGGISAGIDMSLHMVSRLRSLEVAEKTARQMEFDWHKTES
jgi:transcriptional regulator GlxA family with amidase domain